MTPIILLLYSIIYYTCIITKKMKDVNPGIQIIDKKPVKGLKKKDYCEFFLLKLFPFSSII